MKKKMKKRYFLRETWIMRGGFLGVEKYEENVTKGNIAKDLKEVKKKIKDPEVKNSGTLTLKREKENGKEIIKKALIKIEKFGIEKNYKLKFRYVGATNYKVEVTSTDFKTAERILKELTEKISKDMEQEGNTVEFKR